METDEVVEELKWCQTIANARTADAIVKMIICDDATEKKQRAGLMTGENMHGSECSNSR